MLFVLHKAQHAEMGITMEMKNWRRLAAGSVGMLLLVLLFSGIFLICGFVGGETSSNRGGETEMAGAEGENGSSLLPGQARDDLVMEQMRVPGKEDNIPSPLSREETQTSPRKPVVVIDAGHGGFDEGAISIDGRHHEKEVTLPILLYLRELLERSAVEAHYTRLDDTDPPKKERVRMANSLKADAFVSIHCNASGEGDTTAYGMEALYTNRKTAASSLTDSKSLASVILRQTCSYTGRRERGVIRREGLYLLKHSRVPVTIIEVGYLSNESEYQYLMRKENQRRIARGIYQGICKSLHIEGATEE